METATLARMRETIHPQFLGSGAKTMMDWSPAIFSKDRSGEAWAIMRAQRAIAISRLWNFCFADKGRALLSNIDSGRNLFIRGPRNSGRGLLASSIKAVAAMKQVSTSPFMSEFDIFRSEMLECMSFGREGAEAKGNAADKYLDVQLMVVENMRAENTIKYSGEQAKAKFRGADEIDNLIAKRLLSRGSMLITSCDFVGEISITLGERLFDELSSDRTTLVMLVDPGEAIEVSNGLRRAYKDSNATLRALMVGATQREKKLMGGREDAENVVRIEESFYLEDAFDEIPGESKTIQGAIDNSPESFTHAVRERYEEFKADRQAKSAAYKRGIQAARARVVMSSGLCNESPRGQAPRYRMTSGEMSEMGTILALSCSPSRLDAAEAEANKLIGAMGGGA
jgi:hypothetical protein